MSTRSRLIRTVAGLLAGVLLLEAGLQVLRLVSQRADTHHISGTQDRTGGDLRVLCLGACYTVGVGTSPAEAYPAQLERMLDIKLHANQQDAVVINRGVRGRSIDYFAPRINTLLSEHAPDILVVGVNRRLDGEATNRADSFWILPRLLALAWSGSPTPPSPSGEDTGLAGEGNEDNVARRIVRLEAQVSQHPQDTDTWRKLSRAYAQRGQYDEAERAVRATLRPGPIPLPIRLQLLRFDLAQHDYAAVDTWVSDIQRQPQELAHADELREERLRLVEARGWDLEIHRRLEDARICLLRGNLVDAKRLSREVLDIDPDTSDALFLLRYIDYREGNEPRPLSDDLVTRSDPTPLDIAFEAALEFHLQTILSAAQRTKSHVVLHNLAATPAQRPIIAAVAARNNVPLVDLQGALEREPNVERLLLPSDGLRFNAHGNEWMAHHIYQALDAQGWVDEQAQ